MTVEEAKVEEVLQRIEEDVGEEIEVIPQHVRRYGITNMFSRVFSYLLAKKSDGKYIQLRATIAGALKVSSVGAGLEKSEVLTGTATDTLSAAIPFAQVVSRLHVGCTAYELLLYHSPDGVNYYGPIRCYDFYPNVFDISCKSIKVERGEANDVDYEVAGLW